MTCYDMFMITMMMLLTTTMKRMSGTGGEPRAVAGEPVWIAHEAKVEVNINV
jgi:hypothetical protein